MTLNDHPHHTGITARTTGGPAGPEVRTRPAGDGAPRGIAALFVQTGGAYYGIDGVDPWDVTRDARLYEGPQRIREE